MTSNIDLFSLLIFHYIQLQEISWSKARLRYGGIGNNVIKHIQINLSQQQTDEVRQRQSQSQI